MNSYAKKENLIKDKFVPVGDDWREGVTLVISMRVPKPQFEGQTKSKLGNREIQGIVESVVNEKLSIYLEEHPSVAKAIVNKGVNAARVRHATKKVRDLERQRKSPLHSGGLPGKLADCSSKDIESTELYLVEGDSAGGSAKSGRDRRYQAILPLKGKILNVEKARLDKILSHNEIKMIVTALGAGIQNDFDLEKRRYGKLIIMTDADVDGSHIRTLLLTFLFRNMKPLIENGCVYIAQPPLYKFSKRKKEQYVFSDKEFEDALLQFGQSDSKVYIKSKDLAIEGKELESFLKTLNVFEQSLKLLEKYNIEPISFLALRNPETKQLPRFKYVYKNETGYFFSEEELKKFEQEQYEKLGVQINLVEEEYEMTEDSIYLRNIHNSEDVSKCIEKLEKYNLDLNSYICDTPGEYQVSNGKDEVELDSMRCIIRSIKDFGRKGLDVQRYKGLGEMNPEQLWMTTMNPETRTLFKVRLEDVSNAELLFSTLMGSNVEPRRDFIEKHALEVQNLDV